MMLISLQKGEREASARKKAIYFPAEIVFTIFARS